MHGSGLRARACGFHIRHLAQKNRLKMTGDLVMHFLAAQRYPKKAGLSSVTSRSRDCAMPGRETKDFVFVLVRLHLQALEFEEFKARGLEES